MLNKQFNNILKDLGLSENEAKVYLAGLSLGSTTILKISQATEIKRTTIYSVVKSLKQKGLMNIEVKGFKKLYSTEDPEKLKSLLDTKRERLKQFLPELSALFNLKEEGGFLKYYEGLSSVKSLYEQALKNLKPEQDYLAISNTEHWHNLDPFYFQNYVERRAKLCYKARLLLVDSPIARRHQKLEKNYNEKVKILPAGTCLNVSTVILPNMIIFHQLKPPIIAIAVKNQSIIQMHKEVFEIIWRLI